jgi:DNA-binding response OmpR family regulator
MIMKKNIYVLEDDEGIREVIVLLLSEEDYEVHEFANISEFMKADERSLADLFLLDIKLPDGNGIDVCSRLKSNQATKNVPVLMMSAHASKKEVECSCKAQGFVAKPFDIYNLLNKVSLILNA